MALEVERVALLFQDVSLVKVYGKNNPITGQHAEIIASSRKLRKFYKVAFRKHLAEHLQSHMVSRKLWWKMAK